MKIKQIAREDEYILKMYFYKQLEKTSLKEIEPKGVKQKHDKTLKYIMSNKEEMAKFLCDFIGIIVNEESLEEQKNSFITEKFEKREADTIYKLKNSEIYFLVEYQSSVDKNMPKRMIKYSFEVINAASNDKKVLVVPIVVYVGEKKWKVPTNFAKMQNGKYKKYLIKQKYELIDVSKYKKEELIEKNTKMSSMMLIEKCKTKEEVIDILLELIKLADEERLRWIAKIVEYILDELLGEVKVLVLELISKMLEKEEKNMDEEWIERIKRNERKKEKKLTEAGITIGRKEGLQEGKREGVRVGKKETIIEIVKNMLKLNQDENTIMKFTNAKREDIEEAKRQMV